MCLKMNSIKIWGKTMLPAKFGDSREVFVEGKRKRKGVCW
jgi:hypothetical protein